ncbi:MAG: TatD family hydrolase [Nitrososphaerota archaeon]|nr:TatD family hydrolase [Candidatus Geocrenenecus dongiae]
MMIDVHCHLTDDLLFTNLKDVLEEALESGVVALVTSGLGYEDCLKTLEISDNRRVYPSLGIMPYNLHGYDKVIELARKNRYRIVAIGEVGLDYSPWVDIEREFQKKVFVEFIELARELDLPLVTHSRSAGKYVLEILLENNVERVVMHAYDGSSSTVSRAVEKGYFFSIPPSIARSTQKQKLVRKIPLENLLLESDAPALSPNPGEVNKPSNIKISAEWISKLKSIPLDKVKETIMDNTLRIFEIKI